MKKTTFWILMAILIATTIVSIIGICQGKVGAIIPLSACIVAIIYHYSLYSASNAIAWYKEYFDKLESENEELKKAISAKDEAIASCKWQIEALKKKIR